MTLLKLFNDTLKQLPKIADDLEQMIAMQDWPKGKTEQAISIVSQLKEIKLESCISFSSDLSYQYNYIWLTQYHITLSPKECNLRAKTFTPENISKADKYFNNLLAEITQLASGTIRFYYSGHLYDDYTCTFTISWEF